MLALAGMRQTASGQYLKGASRRRVGREGFDGSDGTLYLYILTELPAQHTSDLHMLTQNSVKSAL